MKKNKKPEIRFKGFFDDWKQRKFEEIFNYERPDNYIVKSDKYENNESTPVLTANKAFILGYTSEKNTYKKTNTSIIFDDFTLDSKYVDFPYMVKSSAIKILTLKDTKIDNLKFNYELLHNTKFNMMEHARHYISIVQSTSTMSTNKEEQNKISNFIENIDSLITLNQSKYDKLKNIKVSLLGKMFPKDNEKVPQIRFKGITDTWEQRKLNEVSNRFDNLRIPVAANLRENGNIPYYGANGIQDYVKGYTHKGEFVLVAEDGANDLKNYPVQYVNGYFWSNNHVHVLQAKEKIANNKFLKYRFSQINIQNLLVGGDRAKLNANIMMNIELKIPAKIKEQNEIGELFYKIDNLIILYQSKLEKLKNLKESLINKMFI